MLLEQFLEQKVTCYHQSFADYTSAIKACGQPLIEQGFIDERYIDAVLACVEKYGPYIVIAPDIAMPHATEGIEGVFKTAIGFMKVEEPVRFDENDREKDARLFFMLATNDANEHLNNMMQLSEMLMNEELVQDLLKVKCDDDLRALAEKYKTM